jgi:hypothetical protein
MLKNSGGLMLTVNEENFFDIAEAIHCFATLNHEGQTSALYSILSQSEFRPGPLWSESRVMEENDWFHELTEENIESTFENLQKFMPERKD